MMEGNPGARARLVGFAMLVAVFVAGGLAGAAVIQVRSTDGGDAERPEAAERRCRDRREPYAYLNLTPEQRARVEDVLERRRRELDAFWEENGPRMEMIVDSARAEFRSVLTDEQRAEYDRRRAAERERRKQRERECDQARRSSAEQESR